MTRHSPFIAVALQLCGILGCSEPNEPDKPPTKATTSEFIEGCNILTAIELQEIATAVSSVVEKDPSVLAVRNFITTYGPTLEKYPPPRALGVFRFVDSEWVSEGVTDAVTVTLKIDDWEMFGEARDMNHFEQFSLSQGTTKIFTMISDRDIFDASENDKYIFEAGLWSNTYDGGGFGQCGYSAYTSAVMPYGIVTGSHCGREQYVRVLLNLPGIRLTAELRDSNAIVKYNGYSRSTTDAQTSTCNFDFPSEIFDLEFFEPYLLFHDGGE